MTRWMPFYLMVAVVAVALLSATPAAPIAKVLALLLFAVAVVYGGWRLGGLLFR